jgi:hypothetical protein
VTWWGRQGSNLRPRDYESPALTTELLPLGCTEIDLPWGQSLRTHSGGANGGPELPVPEGYRVEPVQVETVIGQTEPITRDASGPSP